MSRRQTQTESGRTTLVRGDLLKTARMMKGLGLEAFQASMGRPDVALATIKKAESGGPSYLATIRRLCDALELQPETVILRDDAPVYIPTSSDNWASIHIRINVAIRKDDTRSVQLLMAILGMLNQILPEKDAVRITNVEDDAARREEAWYRHMEQLMEKGLIPSNRQQPQMSDCQQINSDNVFAFRAGYGKVHDNNDYNIYNISMMMHYSQSSHKALSKLKARAIERNGVTLTYIKRSD